MDEPHSLLRPPRSRLLALDAYGVHANEATELNADDADGEQGGQKWIRPTASPSATPTTAEPTSAPTSHPTLRGEEFILRGIMWYDRNANGERDSNAAVPGMGADVEYSHGVGGVSVQLVECDVSTGRKYISGQAATKYASAITQGYDARMVPQIVPASDQNAKFNIHLPGLERYYYVQVTAPTGYLFTAGICNDKEEGWQCNYSEAIKAAEAVAAPKPTRRRRLNLDLEGEPIFEKSVGIQTGRSTQCVYIDKLGTVSSLLNFGVMRVGDARPVGTEVALHLEFDSIRQSHSKKSSGRLLMAEILRRATVVDEVDDGVRVTTRYLLAERDKTAIGIVTAEVLASTSLDHRLAEHGVTLDSVEPKDVIVANVRPSKADGTPTEVENELAVQMEVKGHYSPPPELDFAYIVQDSINRDKATIRRGLTEYNSNCRDQTSKVKNQGAKEEDFSAVASTSGTNNDQIASLNDVFSTACSSNFIVPEYFETSLMEIEARKVTEVVRARPVNEVTVLEEHRPIMELWAMGPVAAISGLIVLLVGGLVFRRAIGPRYVDKHDASKKTKDVDGGEDRRFGEAGGDVDDGSVDSAFYSDSDEEESRRRRKRKEKDDEQGRRGGMKKLMSTKSLRKGKKQRSLSLIKKERSKRFGKLAASQGSEATGSGSKASSSDKDKNKDKKLRSSRSKRYGKLADSHVSSCTIDSAFYSDVDDLEEETGEERKKRLSRKEKEKERLLRGLTKSRTPSSGRGKKHSASVRDLSREGVSAVRNLSRSKSARNLSRSTNNLSRSTSSRNDRNLSRSTNSRNETNLSRSTSSRNFSRSQSTRNLSDRRMDHSRNLSMSTNSALRASSNNAESRRRRRKSVSQKKLSMSDTTRYTSESDGDMVSPRGGGRRREGRLAASAANITQSRSSEEGGGGDGNTPRWGGERRGSGKGGATSAARRRRRATVDGPELRRGRSDRPGGDNARIFDAAEIV